MNKKHPLLFGTFLLTLTGLLSRVIGFFYRIYLSKAIGEEGMGIYQLLAPVMVLSFSICSAGMQTAISKFVAGEPTTHDYKSSCRFLLVGIAFTTCLSALISFLLYQNAPLLAENVLLESRCEPLLRLFALSIPFAGIHSCINGYYYGIKNTVVPSASQLIEQLTRVGSVYLIHAYCVCHHIPLRISISVIGLLFGEIASSAISVFAIMYRFHLLHTPIAFYGYRQSLTSIQKLLTLAVPLSGNRIVINLLQSVEAVQIPNRMQIFGMTNETALSVYGVLTGMVLPLILFPNTLTGSISVLLLPYVSESQESHDHAKIKYAIRKSTSYSLLLGFACTLFFFLTGPLLGKLLFGSTLAGTFIRSMSFICPFLYLSTVLGSIMHGLGRAGTVFFYNTVCLAIRLLFVFFAIPRFGITGYLWGLLLSEMILSALQIYTLYSYAGHD